LNNFIEINNLSKNYKINENDNLKIIDNQTLIISQNSINSIVGPSGSGKSTFLNILGLLDSDFNGEYLLNDLNIKELKSSELNKLRGLAIGFIHQFFHLIPELNVVENVMLPNLINLNEHNVYKKAKKLLNTFGLNERLFFKPNKLSGGEQQRVAIARSLINNPDLILADEMTGNLDQNTGKEIFDFFINYIKTNNKSLIFVTHNEEYSKKADEIYYFKNKKLIKQND